MFGFSLYSHKYEEKNLKLKNEVKYEELLQKLDKKLQIAKENKNKDEIEIVQMLINKIKSR